MVADHRGSHLDRVREWIGIGVQPVYQAVQAPQTAWGWLTGSFSDRAQLRTENTQLKEQLRVANVKLLQFDALREENARLREMRAASVGIGQRTLIAEILRVDVDPFRHRVLINKGTSDGVFKGQAVVDAHGIFGQVTRAGRFASEVILISDAEHAIPVQINRNGIRSIAVGAGDLHELTLPFLTGDADVKVNDLLISSGLGGIFPAGYPVARVTKVDRDPGETFAVVEAKPLAQLDRTREVLLIWFDRPVSVQLPEAEPPVPAPPEAITESAPAAAPATSPGTAPERAPATSPPAVPPTQPATGE